VLLDLAVCIAHWVLLFVRFAFSLGFVVGLCFACFRWLVCFVCLGFVYCVVWNAGVCSFVLVLVSLIFVGSCTTCCFWILVV